MEAGGPSVNHIYVQLVDFDKLCCSFFGLQLSEVTSFFARRKSEHSSDLGVIVRHITPLMYDQLVFLGGCKAVKGNVNLTSISKCNLRTWLTKDALSETKTWQTRHSKKRQNVRRAKSAAKNYQNPKRANWN